MALSDLTPSVGRLYDRYYITRGRGVPVAPPRPRPRRATMRRARSTPSALVLAARRCGNIKRQPCGDLKTSNRLPTRWTANSQKSVIQSVSQSVSQSQITVFIMLTILRPLPLGQKYKNVLIWDEVWTKVWNKWIGVVHKGRPQKTTFFDPPSPLSAFVRFWLLTGPQFDEKSLGTLNCIHVISFKI